MIGIGRCILEMEKASSRRGRGSDSYNRATAIATETGGRLGGGGSTGCPGEGSKRAVGGQEGVKVLVRQFCFAVSCFTCPENENIEFKLNMKLKNFSPPSVDRRYADELAGLWSKYREELREISQKLAIKAHDMRGSAYGVAFGDIEGELLYILVRETKPEVIFEISPNSGYSTNYLLAAVSRNGVGVVESFELIESFGERSTFDVIRGNLIDLCEPGRWNLNLGDARVEVIKKLKECRPDFTLIDSCHDDFFSEFYIKSFLPRIGGTVVVQDILHFDPRSEGATEAEYLLSYLYESGTSFVPFALYEDEIASLACRAEFVRRNPARSNAIILFPEAAGRDGDDPLQDPLLSIAGRQKADTLDARYPLNSTVDSFGGRARFRDRSKPEDRYVAAMYGGTIDEIHPGYADVLALMDNRAEFTETVATSIVASFDRFDANLQVGIIEKFVHTQRKEVAQALLRRIDEPRGTVLPERLAIICGVLGMRADAFRWIEICRRHAADRTLPLSYRSLLNCAVAAEALGEAAVADDVYRDILGAREELSTLYGRGFVAQIAEDMEARSQEAPMLKALMARNGG